MLRIEVWPHWRTCCVRSSLLDLIEAPWSRRSRATFQDLLRTAKYKRQRGDESTLITEFGLISFICSKETTRSSRPARQASWKSSPAISGPDPRGARSKAQVGLERGGRPPPPETAGSRRGAVRSTPMRMNQRQRGKWAFKTEIPTGLRKLTSWTRGSAPASKRVWTILNQPFQAARLIAVVPILLMALMA